MTLSPQFTNAAPGHRRETSKARATRPPDAAIAAMERILQSALFRKSPSMSRLLRYVVENGMAGDGSRLSEYSIGVEAMGKKPEAYSPGDDPSVRVQMGRLRERLRRYYASGEASAGEPRLEIPPGGYAPVLTPGTLRPGPRVPDHRRSLTVGQIEAIALDPAAMPLARGLREELLHRLFHELRSVVTLVASGPGSVEAALRLQGSLRLEAGAIRTTLRLVDQASGRLLRSEQFDHADAGTLPAQESIAAAICARMVPAIGAACE